MDLSNFKKVFYDWCVTLWKCIDKYFIDKENGGDWYGYLRRDCTVFNKLKVNDLLVQLVKLNLGWKL